MRSQYLAQFSSYCSDSTCSEKPVSFCFERYMVRCISCYFRRSVFAHHTYSDLPLCDHHISLSSHRTFPIRPVLKSYFHYGTSCFVLLSAIAFRPSPYPHHLVIRVTCHFLSTVYHHGRWEADLRGPRMGCCTYAC